MLRPDKAVMKIKEQVEQVARYKGDYLALAWILFFFIVFFQIASLKEDPASAYATRDKILGDLFGQTFNMDTTTVEPDGGIVETFDSRDNIYSWLGGIMDTFYTSPTCGDTKCQGELDGWQAEVAGQSTFEMGCAQDCGPHRFIENVTITIEATALAPMNDRNQVPGCPENEPCNFDTRDINEDSLWNPLKYLHINVCYDLDRASSQAKTQFGQQKDQYEKKGCLFQNGHLGWTEGDQLIEDAKEEGTRHPQGFLELAPNTTKGIPKWHITDVYNQYTWDSRGTSPDGDAKIDMPRVVSMVKETRTLTLPLVDGPYKLDAFFISEWTAADGEVKKYTETCEISAHEIETGSRLEHIKRPRLRLLVG